MKYALLIVDTMTVKKFNTKDDWRHAIATIQRGGKICMAFKYNDDIGGYYPLEQPEPISIPRYFE